MIEQNPWEFLYNRLENIRLHHSDFLTPSTKSSPQKKCFIGKSDIRAELILCTLCNSIIIVGRLADHFRRHHKEIGEPSTDLCIAVSPSHSWSERSLSFKHSEDLQTFTSNSTNLEPSNTYRHDILQECFPSSWNHDDGRGRTPQAFTSSFNASNEVPGIDISMDVPASVESSRLEDGNNVTTASDFFDFYDIFRDTSDLYDNKTVKSMTTSLSTAPGNDISFADIKDSNYYFNDLLHSTTQDNEAEKASNMVSHRNQAVSQSMNAYLSALHESESYLAVGRSETSDCQSHMLETPSPDFFTLPSASSSSTYSVDSSVFNNTEVNSQCLNSCLPDQSVYAKNYENKSPPTSMPILVRFNNATPARIHGETDVEVEQAVASIVDLEDEPAEKKTSDQSSASGQPPNEQKGNEKLPVLSPMNAAAISVSDPPASNGWMDSSAVGLNGTTDIDWEIWDSLELPSCGYADGDTSESLPLLKPNDLLSSLEPYLQESNESQGIFEVSMDPCPVQQQHQQQSQELQQEPLHLSQPIFPIEQPALVSVTTTTTEQQTIKLTTTTAESKPSKSESSSRSRRSMDCMNGSLPLHLWPFDPRLHCGVQRDGTVCRRSLLCKLHSMGLKRQVERPQDIGLLVKQLREAKRLKKLSYPKSETSEASLTERRTASSAFILPSTSSHSTDPLRSKNDHHSQIADNGGFKYISGVTPIKPAIEVAQAQPLGGLGTNSRNIAATAPPTFLRCAYTGNQLQISTGLISNHTGLHIVEKPLQIQSAAFPQAATGVPSHSGLTVISDGIQASSLQCDQSIFAHRSGAAATPYLHFDQSGNRTATTFLQNRQLCTVIGVAQKTMTQYESPLSTASAGTPSVTTSATPTSGYLALNSAQQAPGTQAATIIVGHPEGTSGTVQYANDKVDSINLLSPNAGPGCISLPPRSARVFQLILPQSATALSLRPHPGSIGSASVIQLTTTGSPNLGTATIPLKQTPVMIEAGSEAQNATTTHTTTIEETQIQEATTVELQTSGEIMDSHKTVQPDSSSLMTLAEWEELHKNGSIVLPTSNSIGYTEVSSSTAAITATLANNTETNSETGRISVSTNYDSTPSVLQQQQTEQNGEEETSSWLEFCSPPNTVTMDASNGSNRSGSFVEPLPPAQQSQSNVDQEISDRKSSNSSTNQHSKLRVLLFDMEDEDALEEEAVPYAETMTVGNTDLDSSHVDSRGTTSEAVQLDKLKEGRLFKGCSAVVTTNSIPTAIVAPTAFSIATTNSANVNSTNSAVCGSSSSNTGSPACCNSDELAKESLKDKSNTPLSANKRKHGQENGFHSSNSGSASPLKQKKPDGSTIRLASPVITAPSVTTTSSTITSGSSINARISANTTNITTSTHNTMDVAAPLNTGTILSLQPPSVGSNRLSVGTTQQVEGITLPVSSAVNCGGNIIICSSAPAIQHQQQPQVASIGAWNCQLKSLDTRSSPLTLIRLPNGQLAAVPSNVFCGTQVTLAAPPPPPVPQALPPPPPQQPILQSHGTTLVLRYPQQQTKTGEQFDPSQGTVDASAASASNLTIVNGNYQLQQAPNYQQQRLVMLSPCGKNACYTTTCDHLNDLNSNAINGKSAIAGGNSSNSSGSIASGDQVDTAQVSQTSAVTAAFQQASGTTAQHPQLQSVPAGAMTILVRGANSHSALQLLIPQPDGTMVLQPATMQNQFCSRTAGVPTSTVSLIPQPSPQIQSSQQQQHPAGVFSQPLLQTGYISVPRGEETASLFHSPTGGICAGGQFSTSADDGSGNATASGGSGSGFIEFLAANGMDRSRSILSTAGDLSKWVRSSSNNTKVIGGRVSASQQIFHQQACLDAANPTVIQLPQAAGRATVSQRQQKQQQQVVFLTAPSGAGTTATASHQASFSNVATIVQQSTGLEHGRGLWTTSPGTSGAAVITLPNPSQNQ